MTKKDITIATITLARNEEEEILLRQSLQKLAELDIQVFITDGGSNAGFINFIRSFSHFNLSETTIKGVWQQANNSLTEAHKSGSAFIFYTEPDKFDFFYGVNEMITQVSTHKRLGIVLASRSVAAFATFPSFQQMTETAINNCCAQILAKKFDFTYGPFLFNRKLFPYLNLIKENVGWGWRPFLFGITSRLGYQIESHVGNFFCPADQREDDAKERLYRVKQLSENIQGLLLSVNTVL